ncbi:splicing factor, suppressor of white-apricot homolog isoform X2 [Neovison vison]|uniref:splicing factor, suppressor of white-apricot homolog isoform X2 n=1 Tax=Neovison vison TaxID=452646 RepID=UPI001CF04804|nr:splicing factor, suppressor of white-apricot homolog isoform X2 [Neogale vison]
MPCVMRREEEYKRLSEALAEDGGYNAVGFTYGSDYYDPSEPTEEEEPSKQREKNEAENIEENEEPFVAPVGLNVPPDVELPPTAKMHAIIERTANFVCKQGAQFEIMLKAKQARNSQFDFLRFDHYLNPYYKFIQKAMKEGRYTVPAENRTEEKKKSGVSSDDDDDEGDGSYLHPSLFASKKCNRLEELMKPLKVVDPDHPLAALVRKAQADSPAPTPPSADGSAQPSQAEYAADSTVAAMYYSYYMLPDGTYCLAPPPPGVDVATYYSTLPAGVAVPSSTGVTTTAPPPPGTTPPPPPTTAETSSGVTSTITTSALAPVAAIIPPPPDIQPVIDKLAEYVARNGLKFETSVRAKNDQRFEFLQPWHQYNAYYEFKKQFFLQKEGGDSAQAASATEEAPAESAPEKPSDGGEEGVCEDSADAGRGGPPGKKEASSSKTVADGKLVKASFAPISFAIKAKENDLLPLEKNRVKLDDDSDDDEEGKEGQESSSSATNTNPAVTPPCVVVEEKRPQLTQEELEAKQAKQKLEDRLAAAAREKLAQASKESKEKQLQAERKRKAALFLQTLKNPLPEAEVGKVEENPFSVEEASSVPCPLLAGGRPLPTSDIKPPEGPSSKSKDPPREEEKERKKKKHKKRSRTRSRSPKYHSSSKSRPRSHSKAKHCLPSAYRTARRSRSRSRSPRRRAHSPERRREERSVPTAYRMSNSPGVSRKRTRSRSPHEKKKKRRSRSRTESKAGSQSASPSKQATRRHTAHSASISPVESRGSSQERSRGVSQEKDGQISSAIVSSVQSKITQDLMAKVRAMLAASKNMQTSAS